MEPTPSSRAVEPALSLAEAASARGPDYTALKTRRGLIVLAVTAVATVPADVVITS